MNDIKSHTLKMFSLFTLNVSIFVTGWGVPEVKQSIEDEQYLHSLNNFTS